MSEQSYPWDGLTTGDASIAPFSASEWQTLWWASHAEHASSPLQRSFVAPRAGDYASSLLVTGTATPVTVNPGRALVQGILYILEPSTTIAVASPVVNPRIDRVVLRVSYAAQTVRLALLAGAEAATPSPPALTQSAATWEVSLAQVYITTGGVITVRDERVGFLTPAPGILFRDLRDRVLEEFFDNFNSDSVATPTNWRAGTSGTGTVSQLTTFPSSVRLSTGGASAGGAFIDRNTRYFHRLSQAPLLLEALMAFTGSASANARMMLSLQTAGGVVLTVGFHGTYSATNLIILGTTGGAVSLVTPQAVDVSGAYHKYGLYIPASTGPAIFLYDGVAIGQIATGIHAAATDVKVSIEVGNNGAALSEIMDIDWARLVRGA